MNKVIINYIKNELVRGSEETTLDEEDDLLGSGLVDSLGMMKLINFIEQEFQVKVPPEDMVIENFMTVSCISTYLESKDEG